MNGGGGPVAPAGIKPPPFFGSSPKPFPGQSPGMPQSPQTHGMQGQPDFRALLQQLLGQGMFNQAGPNTQMAQGLSAHNPPGLLAPPAAVVPPDQNPIYGSNVPRLYGGPKAQLFERAMQ